MELIEYVQYKETKLHERPGFAYNTYLCTIPLDFPRVAMHWHEYMELIYIKKGRGTVSVDLTPYPVRAGCIMPVLPGELHSIDGTAGETMEYENIIFSLEILESKDEKDWCRQYVTDALREGQLQFPRPLIPGTPIHTAAASALDAADDACRVRDSISGSIASWILLSEMESSEDVASSKIMTAGSFSSTRAMESRCFSPPESFRPRLPTMEIGRAHV